MQIETLAYGGWANCYKLTHHNFELIITADVGPRIIYMSVPGGNNLLGQNAGHMGQIGGDEWRLYGGHRLWRAPEDKALTYYPDNVPIEARHEGDWLHLLAPTERNGIQKEIQIGAEPNGALSMIQRLWNRSDAPQTLAPWGLSVMAGGGTAIVPLPPRGEHPRDLLPASTLILWSYTDLTDPRLTLGREFIMLRQEQGKMPLKIGAWVPDGWVAYGVQDTLFVKTFTVDAALPYPDMGSSVELFTNQWMLEVETLAPLQTLAPGASAELNERWYLYPDVPTPQTEDDVRNHILPCIPEPPAPEK